METSVVPGSFELMQEEIEHGGAEAPPRDSTSLLVFPTTIGERDTEIAVSVEEMSKQRDQQQYAAVEISRDKGKGREDPRGLGMRPPVPLRPDSSRLHFETKPASEEETSDVEQEHSHDQWLRRRVEVFWAARPEVGKQSTRDQLYTCIERALHQLKTEAPSSFPKEPERLINLIENYLGQEFQEYLEQKALRGSQVSSTVSSPAVAARVVTPMQSPVTMALGHMSLPLQPGESAEDFQQRRAALNRQQRVATGEWKAHPQSIADAGSSVTGPEAASTPAPAGGIKIPLWRDRVTLQKIRMTDLDSSGTTHIKDQGVVFYQGQPYDTTASHIVEVKREASASQTNLQPQDY
ncbi:hypothetical protein H0H92_005912, partial [Tricholoma furcatifolium]